MKSNNLLRLVGAALLGALVFASSPSLFAQSASTYVASGLAKFRQGNLDGAIARLREALDRRSHELGRPWTARTSAGWMVWNPGDGQDLESVLAQADAHLYHDKRSRKASTHPD